MGLHADASDKQFHQRLGHRNQIILSTGMKPCVDHLVHRSDDEPLDQSQIEIPADGTFLLSAFDDLVDDVQVQFGHLSYLVLGHAADLMGFGLIDDGHVPVPLELFEVYANQVAQFVDGRLGAIDLLSEAIENLFGLVAEELDQDIVLVLEIEVDRSVSDTGFTCDLGDRRLVVALPCENRYGSFQNAVVLVVFVSAGDGKASARSLFP